MSSFRSFKVELEDVSRCLQALILAIVLAGPPGGVLAQATSIPYSDLEDSIDAAVQWLVDYHQNEDGGYSSFSQGSNLAPSDISGTADALSAIAAAGGEVSQPLNYFKSHIPEMISFSEIDGSAAGKVVLALVAAGEDPHDFGYDFAAEILKYHSTDGYLGIESAFGHSIAVLGLAAAGEPVPEASLQWLRDRQESNGEFAGSWDDGFGTEGNPDATAAAVLALAAAGLEPADDVVSNALTFLEQARLPAGGWEYGTGFGENANSTALVIRALQATGIDPNNLDSEYAQDGRSPVEVLLSWQGASGAFQADFGDGRTDDFFATVQAVPALVDAQSQLSEAGSNVFGGESSLPYWLLGLLAIVFLSLVIWYLRARSKTE